MARVQKIEDKPYVENYPPLRDWLRQIGARCDWQVPLGNAKDPSAYIEQWQTPGGRSFVVVVHAQRNGWNIYTDCGDNSIETTLVDAANRIGLVGNMPKAESWLITVAYLDPGGLPRAWGRALTEEAADGEAKRQLAIYREKKAELGDPLATAEYTRKVMES